MKAVIRKDESRTLKSKTWPRQFSETWCVNLEVDNVKEIDRMIKWLRQIRKTFNKMPDYEHWHMLPGREHGSFDKVDITVNKMPKK